MLGMAIVTVDLLRGGMWFFRFLTDVESTMVDWQGDALSVTVVCFPVGPAVAALGALAHGRAPGGPWGPVTSCFFLLVHLWGQQCVCGLPHGNAADACELSAFVSPKCSGTTKPASLNCEDWHYAKWSIFDETETQARIFGSLPRSQEFIASLTVT